MLEMMMRLIPNLEHVQDLVVPALDPEEDDVRSLLSSACEQLASSLSFEVAGFGDEAWPVDVRTDLPVLLEQLPVAIASARDHRGFNIDFYEQGVERRMSFLPSGSDYAVRCESLGTSEPFGTQEAIARDELLALLVQIRDTFARVVAVASPAAAAHPWFVSWTAGDAADA